MQGCCWRLELHLLLRAAPQRGAAGWEVAPRSRRVRIDPAEELLHEQEGLWVGARNPRRPICMSRRPQAPQPICPQTHPTSSHQRTHFFEPGGAPTCRRSAARGGPDSLTHPSRAAFRPAVMMAPGARLELATIGSTVPENPSRAIPSTYTVPSVAGRRFHPRPPSSTCVPWLGCQVGCHPPITLMVVRRTWRITVDASRG